MDSLETTNSKTGLPDVNHAILQIEDFSSDGKNGKTASLNERTSSALSDANSKKTSHTQNKTFKERIQDGIINVQYNPLSIKYSGSLSRGKTEKEEGDLKIITITNTGRLNMSFELVFHASDEQDTSVQDQMQLIINMLQSSPTKNVIFSWGNISVKGKVVSFSGSYDMFSSMGKPVSGKMSMTIQSDISSSEVGKMIKDMGKQRNDKVAENVKKQ